MDEYLKSLVGVVQRTFDVMFGSTPELLECRREDSENPPYEVSGIIGVTGSARGSIVISLPRELADDMTRRMLGLGSGAPAEEVDISDCVGELANIVAGNYLPAIQGDGAPCQISLPTVVIGQYQVVWRRKDTPYDMLRFQTAQGVFCVEIRLASGSGTEGG